MAQLQLKRQMLFIWKLFLFRSSLEYESEQKRRPLEQTAASILWIESVSTSRYRCCATTSPSFSPSPWAPCWQPSSYRTWCPFIAKCPANSQSLNSWTRKTVRFLLPFRNVSTNSDSVQGLYDSFLFILQGHYDLGLRSFSMSQYCSCKKIFYHVSGRVESCKQLEFESNFDSALITTQNYTNWAWIVEAPMSFADGEIVQFNCSFGQPVKIAFYTLPITWPQMLAFLTDVDTGKLRVFSLPRTWELASLLRSSKDLAERLGKILGNILARSCMMLL